MRNQREPGLLEDALAVMRNRTPHGAVRISSAIAVAVMSCVLTASPVGATDTVVVHRYSGADRYATAAAISRATFPNGAFQAVLARGDLFPDALAAAHLAGAFNGGGPILLTLPDHLPSTTLSELKRLDVRRVQIMGSDDAVSADIEATLRSEGFETRRTAGATRYETAVAASTPDPDNAGDVALLASGERFADAMAAGPLSYPPAPQGLPLLLTPTNSLHPATRDALVAHHIARVIILGGTASVSTAVEAQVRAICPTTTSCIQVERIAGRNRSETATRIADHLVEESGDPVLHVNLARGDAFPDALAGAAHAGDETGPILFAESPTSLGDATRDWLRAHADTIESIDVFGDSGAVSDAVVADARAAATA